MSVQNVLKLCTKPYEVGPNVQYGQVAVTGGTGTTTVVLPKAYTDLTYVVTAEMGDAPASQTYVTKLTTSSFTLGWQSAGTGSHTLMYTCSGTSYSIFGVGTSSTNQFGYSGTAEGPTYTAGTNISLNNNQISTIPNPVFTAVTTPTVTNPGATLNVVASNLTLNGNPIGGKTYTSGTNITVDNTANTVSTVISPTFNNVITPNITNMGQNINFNANGLTLNGTPFQSGKTYTNGTNITVDNTANTVSTVATPSFTSVNTSSVTTSSITTPTVTNPGGTVNVVATALTLNGSPIGGGGKTYTSGTNITVDNTANTVSTVSGPSFTSVITPLISNMGQALNVAANSITLNGNAMVSRIIAGTGITISPSTGYGDVTINSTGGGGSAKVICSGLMTFNGQYSNLPPFVAPSAPLAAGAACAIDYTIPAFSYGGLITDLGGCTGVYLNVPIVVTFDSTSITLVGGEIQYGHVDMPDGNVPPILCSNQSGCSPPLAGPLTFTLGAIPVVTTQFISANSSGPDRGYIYIKNNSGRTMYISSTPQYASFTGILGQVYTADAPTLPPPEGAPFNLINTVTGNTLDTEWTNIGSPTVTTVYVEQSADSSTWTNYTSSDSYSPDSSFYYLPDNYYYRFKVVASYSGILYTSAYSSPEFVFGM